MATLAAVVVLGRVGSLGDLSCDIVLLLFASESIGCVGGSERRGLIRVMGLAGFGL
jgi:hypothetical protein